MDFNRFFGLRALIFFLLLFCVALPVAAQSDPPAETPPATESGEMTVETAIVCLSIEERQPVGEAESFPADVEELTCFTRIVGGEGKVVVHAWIHEGTTRARVELEIGSNSWRTWSTKRILPSWTGSWELKIMTPEGKVLSSVPFTIY